MLLQKSNAMLVFESDPIWKGVLINDIKDDMGNIDFKWKFPLDSAFNTDVLKVYFFNPVTEIAVVKPINCVIK